MEVEATKYDAIDLPNYTLVLPLQVVTALYSVVLAKSWKELVENPSNVSNMTSLTENYVNNIVKFINIRLNVPNLVIIDTKSDKMYYKFQFMSKINKINISTIQTYVNTNLNKEFINPY
jgi:hypothetical protein